ncbi:MAG: hypothetical protein QW819_05355 [Candidatus Korarchaeota archaeon]|nr:hypothetical protein [Thermoproteota archaeon]MCR8472455.1 hypothetical protein [Thermoproteota archaeon]MCR8473481.1 hypothetical protein [Thermoproteota archaeon]MCR8488796.1 hypothetical protein [Thermoproteota archaeon]
MRLVGLNSDRACIADIENDNIEELVYTKLSDIIILDTISNKIKRQIHIKPRAMKQRAEFDQEIYRDISTEDHIDLQRTPSIAGEVILKMHVKDVNGDGKPEIVILRVDGIIACYDVDGHEKWSFFLDPHIVDLATTDRGELRVVVISGYGFLYAISIDGKLYKVDLKDFSGSPLALTSVDSNAGLYAILSREGTIHLVRIELAKEVFKKVIKVSYIANLDLPKHAESTSLHAMSLSGGSTKEALIAGLSDGTVLVIDLKSMEIRARIKLPDRISRIFELPGAADNIGIALDWLGNLAIIRDYDKIEMYEAPTRRRLVDLDCDGTEEEVSVSTKSLRIKKRGELINEIEGYSYISSYAVDDVNLDGKREIIVAWNSKSVTIYDYSGRVLDSTKTLAIPRALMILDINKDNKKEIIVCSNDSIEVFLLD